MTIDGGDWQSQPYGSTFVISGRAAPGAMVNLNFHKEGTPATDYSIMRQALAGADGRWSRAIVEDTNYRYYASVGALVSATVLSQPAPTVAGPTERTVRKNASYTLSGGAVPGSTVWLHFHAFGTPVTDYSILRSAVTNGSGVWSWTYVASVDYGVYVSGSSQDDYNIASYLIQAR